MPESGKLGAIDPGSRASEPEARFGLAIALLALRTDDERVDDAAGGGAEQQTKANPVHIAERLESAGMTIEAVRVALIMSEQRAGRDVRREEHELDGAEGDRLLPLAILQLSGERDQIERPVVGRRFLR